MKLKPVKMIKNFVKILELLGDRLEVCVSVYECYIIYIHSRVKKNTPTCLFVVNESRLQWQVHYVFYDMPIIIILVRKVLFFLNILDLN